MSDICYGTSVPPIPARPIDMTQPAYVLLDGRWVLLADIISEYLPQQPSPASLRIEHVTVPQANVLGLPNTAPAEGTQIVATKEWVPSSPTSRLMVSGVLSVYSTNLPAPTSVVEVQVNLGLKAQLPTGVWPSGSAWSRNGSYVRYAFIGQGQASIAFQADFGPADRRTVDGKWAVGLFGVKSTDNNFTTAAMTDAKFAYTEYEPLA